MLLGRAAQAHQLSYQPAGLAAAQPSGRGQLPTQLVANELLVAGALSYATPVGADSCSFTLTSTAASGSRSPVGTTPVTYTVTDASGNKVTCSFTVTVKASALTLALNSPTFGGGVNVACAGGTSGSATATVHGGCQPYRYPWSNG